MEHTESEKIIFNEIKKRSKEIKKGEITLYLIYCNACEYLKVQVNPPAGPGGTLSCPICKYNNVNSQHIEDAFGLVKSKQFKIKIDINKIK